MIKLAIGYLGVISVGLLLVGVLFLANGIHGPRWLGITLVAGGAVGVIGYFDLGRMFQVR